MDIRLKDLTSDQVGVDDGQVVDRRQQGRDGRLARGDPSGQTNDCPTQRTNEAISLN